MQIIELPSVKPGPGLAEDISYQAGHGGLGEVNDQVGGLAGDPTGLEDAGYRQFHGIAAPGGGP